MAKTAKTENKPEPVYHADELTAKEKNSGKTYTYDWGQVTAPEHLAKRNEMLLKAQETQNAALEAEVSEVKPDEPTV